MFAEPEDKVEVESGSKEGCKVYCDRVQPEILEDVEERIGYDERCNYKAETQCDDEYECLDSVFLVIVVPSSQQKREGTFFFSDVTESKERSKDEANDCALCKEGSLIETDVINF